MDRWGSRGLWALAVVVLCLLSGALPAPARAALPPGFDEVDVATGLIRPTSITFAPDGRMFVAEQLGRVLVVPPGSTTPSVILDIRDQVNSLGDRGLMSIALDRDFAQNHWMYLLYVKEMSPAQPDSTEEAVSVLTRVTIPASGPVTSPQTPVLGKESAQLCPWPTDGAVDCIPSDFRWHAVGTVRTDPVDGTLWVSVGDSKDPVDKTDAKLRRPQDPNAYNGKLLHVDRDGLGLPGHAFCPSVTDLRRTCTKVYAMGFRNPFRFSLRPGGRSPVVGDVGDASREEVDLVEKGHSYGWPCWEGTIKHPAYKIEPYCQEVYAAGGQTPPLWDYPHLSGIGDAIVVGPTYTGGPYPASLLGSVFIADYGEGWVKTLAVDDQDQLVGTGPSPFATSWCCAVDLELTPQGDLATVGIGINSGEGPAKIRRFTYDPTGNRAPDVAFTATPATGDAPLGVAFDAGATTDPDGDPLTYTWDFGDGTPAATGVTATHTYTARGTYTARLSVDDGTGRGPSVTTTTIQVGRPPSATILDPVDGALFRGGRRVDLHGAGTDPDGGPVTYSWDVRLIHMGHTHPLLQTPPSATPDAAFTPVEDHDADSHYEVRLTVTDADGLQTTRLTRLWPETRAVTLASSPAGAPLQYIPAAERPAPFTTQALIGYRATIAAAATFSAGGSTYLFTGWSDGGARQHDITVPATASTFTATYCVVAPAAPGRCTATVPPAGGTAPDRIAPVISHLRLGSRVLSRSLRAPFALSEPARVRATLARVLSGRLAGTHCVAPTGAPPHARACRRLIPLRGVLVRRMAAGSAHVLLHRRFGGRMLPRGHYELALVAEDASGNRSRAVRGRFTVRP